MSIHLPTRQTDDGPLEDVEYFDATEVAARIGMTPQTVRRHTTGVIGDWPYLKLARSPYMTEEHIARVIELLTHDPDQISEGDRPARLGIPCSDRDLEDIDR